MAIDLGNRGKCAQPCRMPYELVKEISINNYKSCEKGYLLSPKDLSIIEILNKIPNVACLKIEGRMKSPEYVATVVSTYRKYIDNLSDTPTDKDKEELAQIFNRGGFSTAYLQGKHGKDTMCYEKPKNWGIYVGKIISYDGKSTITVSNNKNVNLIIGDGIEVWNGENESPSCIISNLTITNEGVKIGKIKGNIKVGNKVYRTSSKVLNQSAKESYTRGFIRHKKIDTKFIMHHGNPVKLEFENFKYISNVIPEKAQKLPITEEKIHEQLIKSGNTPFEFEKIDFDIDNDLFLPVSKINEIRRNALQEYENHLTSLIHKNVQRKELPIISSNNNNNYSSKKEVSCFFNVFSEDLLQLKNIDNYYFNFKDAIKNIDLINNFNGKKYVLFPTITKANYAKYIKENIHRIMDKVDGFVISNIGQLEYLEEAYYRNQNPFVTASIARHKKIELIANYTFNTFNSYTVELLHSLGISKIILSPELTKNQINNIAKKTNKIYENSQKPYIEVICYGNICVMTSEYCPIGSIVGGFCKDKQCSKPCVKGEKYYLKDRMNMLFRVIPDNIDCQSRIFNSKINSIETKDLFIDSIRLDFIDETISEMQEAIDLHLDGGKFSGEKYTNGHFIRPV